jgi:hypothetical protein
MRAVVKKYRKMLTHYELGVLDGKAAKQAEAEALVESDAADLWRVTNAIKAAIQAREWILEGRGQYLWDDQRYRQETGAAFAEVLELIEKVQPPAQGRFSEFMAAGALQRVVDRSRTEGRILCLEGIDLWLEEVQESHTGEKAFLIKCLRSMLWQRLQAGKDKLAKESSKPRQEAEVRMEKLTEQLGVWKSEAHELELLDPGDPNENTENCHFYRGAQTAYRRVLEWIGGEPVTGYLQCEADPRWPKDASGRPVR